ncbi:hypothetical protein CR161_09400 [Prosthecochloris sp. ZM]|uniref:Cas10/Cmr2 second palm domain-containing protein n=1 Tax=Prosthecochloris sp. ZM TaxID=2283143 RepID=UPI000DF84DA6|nr:hypothetical protein [Prosthecochloris sp. ZM]RDD30897.1 hypothetical protein CR161_09400 [Prosthecochloris sp. ZM]
MPVLTGIDILGVQRFVFSSNRLQDVVGGSFLVHWATAADGALRDLVSGGNILLAAGGNAILEFSAIDKARVFAARYSRRIYDKAPGLEVVIRHRNYESGGLAQALQDVQIDLAKMKKDRLPSVPLLGLSVTASCAETGLPATEFNPSDSKPQDTAQGILSDNIWMRREQSELVKGYWQEFLKDGQDSQFDFPSELDQLGRDKGDTSLIGVVHVDGNGVGQKIKDWLSAQVDEKKDDEIVGKDYHKWSHSIDQLGQKALQAVVDRIVQSVDKSKFEEKAPLCGTPERLGFKLNKEKKSGKWMLPLRPVLLGGDDLTFICDGRIALDLAKTALGVFEGSDIPHLGSISASAGVAIVGVHFPFARAYELAEKLCSSAKQKLKETTSSGCALDWHIGIARPGKTVNDIRKKHYQSNGTSRLTCRPYILGTGKDEEETWRWLSGTLLDDPHCGIRGEVWSDHRSKVKAFAGLVHEGTVIVNSSLDAWRKVDDKLRLPDPIDHDGFIAASRTPVLDAVELVDLHLVLKDAGEEEGSKPEVKQ